MSSSEKTTAEFRATVVGAGEVFCQRYLPALREIRPWIEVPEVIDVRPASEVEAAIQQAGGEGISVHRLLDTSPTGLVSLLRANGLLERPVILATPSPVHAPQASALLAAGATVCIEKPFAISESQVSELDRVVATCKRPPFLLGYYALEKGLPALALARGVNASDAYLEQIEPHVDATRMGAIRSTLGRVTSVRAVLLEGRGLAGSLEQRPWVLEHEFGGNTVETFYHLVCMTLPFLETKPSIGRVSLMQHLDTTQRFRDMTGREMAETLTSATLVSGEAKVSLLCAKYVPSSLHERWMEVEFERGTVRMDFETTRLVVESREETIAFRLKRATRYVTQLSLLAGWLRGAHTPVEYALFRDALHATLELRRIGVRNGIGSYRTDELTREWRDNELMGPIADLP